jgi:hypothetical protein
MDLYERTDSIIATVPESDLPHITSIYYGMTRIDIATQICNFQDYIDGTKVNTDQRFTREFLIDCRNRAIAFYNLGQRVNDYFWNHGHEHKIERV